MSANASLALQYSASTRADSLPDLRLTIEPEYTGDGLADLADIDAMLVAAMSGLSARSRLLERCKWAAWQDDGSLVLTLAFYVWPSHPDLIYQIHAPSGVVVSPPVAHQESRSWKYWIAGSKTLELPWHVLSPQMWWHGAIGCYDAFSRPVQPPPMRQEFARIELDAEAYGVFEVSGAAQGFRHELSIRYSKIAFGADTETLEGKPRISAVEADPIKLRATWLDERGEGQEATAELPIPPCVRELLAACPNGTAITSGQIKHGSGGAPTLFYSTCNGRIIARRRG